MKFRINPSTTTIQLFFFGWLLLGFLGCGPGEGSQVQPSDPRRMPSCAELYPEPQTLADIEFLPAANFQFQGNENVAFLFNDWCPFDLTNDTLCRCRWTFSALQLTFTGTYQLPANIQARLTEPHKDGPVHTSYDLEHDGNGLMIEFGDGMSVIKGSSLALELGDGPLPEGLKLVAGGLCIVENIDGGDPGNP